MSYVGPLRASGRFFDGRPSRPRNSIKMENESRNALHGLDLSRLRVSASRWIPRTPPPHLVVFLSDDHGAIGDAPRSALDMRTSHMTRVAKAGLLFKQAFVNSPACARSRAALLTGQNPSGKGAEANHTKRVPNCASCRLCCRDLATRLSHSTRFPATAIPRTTDSNSSRMTAYTTLDTRDVGIKG